MEIRDVDICITTYNRLDRLKHILKSLSHQTNMNFNLIVNDDGSRETLNPNDFPIVTRYLWAKDTGFNKVARCNESVLQCVSPKIIMIDDDCVPATDTFIAAHIECLDRADVSCGGVVFPDGNKATWFSGANIAFRKSVLKDYGIYFPGYNGHYGREDIDLGEQLNVDNAVVVYNDRARVLTGSDMYLNGDRSNAVVGRNSALFKQRFPNFKWGVYQYRAL
jgi:glycosyltransferase involved in cell wall biosynthesis